MLHNRTSYNPANHYAANVSGGAPYVLAQLQEASSTGHCALPRRPPIPLGRFFDRRQKALWPRRDSGGHDAVSLEASPCGQCFEGSPRLCRGRGVAAASLPVAQAQRRSSCAPVLRGCACRLLRAQSGPYRSRGRLARALPRSRVRRLRRGLAGGHRRRINHACRDSHPVRQAGAEERAKWSC